MALPVDHAIIRQRRGACLAGPDTRELRASGGRAEPSFDQVYRSCFVDVARWVRALGANPADIEDLTQEVFIIVRRKLASFDGHNLPGFLYRIAQRTVRDHRRSAWIRRLKGQRSSVPDLHARETERAPAPARSRAAAPHRRHSGRDERQAAHDLRALRDRGIQRRRDRPDPVVAAEDGVDAFAPCTQGLPPEGLAASSGGGRRKMKRLREQSSSSDPVVARAAALVAAVRPLDPITIQRPPAPREARATRWPALPPRPPAPGR